MSTVYNIKFSQGGSTNQTIPRTFALNSFARAETPQWTSGRADRILDTYINCRLSPTRDRTVTLNYIITSGGVTLQTFNFTKEMKAGSIYNCSAGLKNFNELTPAEVTAFIGGLPTATLTLNAGFSSGAELNLYRKGGVEFSFAIAFEDLEGSTFSLDKTEYTSGDRPIVTIEPMETDETLVHGYYWTLAGHSTEEMAITGATETLAALPDDFASYLDGKVSDTLTFHGITYENGVKLGERTIDVIFTAKDMIPTVEITAAPSDGGSDYWERFDSCVLTITCNSAHSTDQSLEITGDYSYSGAVVSTLTVPVFQAGGEKKFTATYTNARGQIATASVSINVQKLKPPTVEFFEAQRYEQSADDDGNIIFKWSLTSQKVRVRYKWSVDNAGGNVTASDVSLAIRYNGSVVRGTANALTGTVEFDDRSPTSADKSILNSLTFDSNAEHALTFTVSDGKNNSSASVTIPKARVNLHLAGSDYGVGIGCFVTDSTQENPIFRVAYPAEFLNGIKGIEIPVPVLKLDDTDTYSNANNALIIHDVTVEESGWYFLQANFEFGNNANGRRGFEVEVTGEVHSVPIALMLPPVNGDAMRGNANAFIYLYADDVLHFRTYQTSGAALTVSVRRQLVKVF